MLENIEAFCPAALPFRDALVATFVKYQISTAAQRRMFLAQYAHETGGFKVFTENLNYSAESLIKTWPKRFTPELAAECARNPQKIANIAYANRMGNGAPETGEGWKYRGRGLCQLTGKQNYHQFSIARYADDRLLENPDALLQADDACAAGGWFWSTHGCGKLADAGDLVGLTKAINGGILGLEDRARWLKIAEETIS